MTFLQSLKAARKGANKAGAEARKAVDELRALRVRLLDERDAVEARPGPLEEAQDAAAQAVLREAERALDDVSLAPLMRPADGRKPRLDLSERQIAALAFACCTEGVADLIGAKIAQRYASGPEPMAPADKAAELDRIDGELLAVELAEEGAIRELEAAGFEVQRRPDADPRALLAADSEIR